MPKKTKRRSYTELFLEGHANPSLAAREAAAIIDRLLFEPDERFDLLSSALEWIAEGWGHTGVPSPPMIAAAILNEAEGYKSDPESSEESVAHMQRIAAAVLKPYLTSEPVLIAGINFPLALVHAIEANGWRDRLALKALHDYRKAGGDESDLDAFETYLETWVG